MRLNKIALSLLLTVSSLLAIDPVSNLSVSAPHNSGSVTNDDSIEFTWTPPSNVARYYYKLDTNGTNYNLVSEGGYSVLNSTGSTLSVTAASSGSYYLHLVAVDGSDITSAPKIVQVTSPIDLDKGTVTMPASSSESGSKSITLNSSESGTLFYTVDGSDVNTSDTSNTGSTKSVSDSSGNPSATFTIAVSATVKAKLVDVAGNVGDLVSTEYTLTNNPSLAKSNDDSAIDGTTVATGTTTGIKITGTGMTRYQYRKGTDNWTTVSDITTPIDISGLSSAQYTYEVRGGDDFNFQPDTAKTSVTFTVDNTAPSALKATVNGIEVDEDNSSTVTFGGDTIPFVLSSNDESATIRYTTNGDTPSKTVGDIYTSTINYSTSSVGSGSTGNFILKMVAYDSVGNISPVNETTITIDKEQPTLTMPTTEELASGSTKTVNLSTNDNEATIYYLVSNSNTATVAQVKAGATGTSAIIGQNPSNSQQDDSFRYLHVLAVDSVGNGDEDDNDIESVTYTFTQNAITLNLTGVIENETIATNSEKNATSPKTTVTISGDNFTYYKYKIDSNAYSAAQTLSTSPASTISITGLSDGEHTLYVGVDTNNSGDFNLSEANLTFVVDNTAPSTMVVNDKNYTTAEYTVTLDKPADATIMYYSTNGGSSFNSTQVSSKDVTITQDVNTSTTIVVYSEDSVGNESNRTSAVFTREAAQTRILSAESSKNFGTQNNYAKTSQNIVVTNSGNSVVTMGNTNLTSSDFVVSNNTCSGIVSIGGTCTVTVDFNATTSGTKNATLNLTYNGTDATELNVSLSGTTLNNIPVATFPSPINVNEDNTTTGALTATDVESTSFTFHIVDDVDNGSLEVNSSSGVFTYTPTQNYNGADAFTYVVSDGEDNSTNKAVSINIASVNDLPEITLSANTIEGNASNDGNITFSSSDVDGDTVTAQVQTQPTKGTVTIDGTTILFDGDANATRGADSFIILFSDGNDGNVTKTVSISIANALPQIIAQDINLSEDTNVTGKIISITDADNDDRIITVTTGVSNGTLTIDDTNISTGDNNQTTYTYVPDADYNGTDSFTIEVNDGFGGVVSKTINITVDPVNDITLATINNVAKNEDSDEHSITLSATDENNNSITYRIVSVSDEDRATAIISGNQLTITPKANANGNVNITVVATDGVVESEQKTFTFNLLAVNDEPIIDTVFSDILLDADINESKKFDLNISDVDGEDLRVIVESNDTSIVSITQNLNEVSDWDRVQQADYSMLDFNITAEGNSTAKAIITITVVDAEGNITTSFNVDLSVAISANSSITKSGNIMTFDTNSSLESNVSGVVKKVTNESNSTVVELDDRIRFEKDDNNWLDFFNSGKVTTKKTNDDGNVSNEISLDVNGSLESNDDGTSIKFSKTIGGSEKDIIIETNTDLTIRPTISGVALPSELPAGTKIDGNDTSIKFQFALPEKLEF